MRKLVLPVLSCLLVSACATQKTQTIDAQSLASVRNQSVATTVREMPSFSVLTLATASFGVIGAVAGIDTGNRLIASNKVPDPADAIAAGLASALQERYGARTLPQPVSVGGGNDAAMVAGAARGKARYVVDVRTGFWMLGYYPTDWTHYRVAYVATARLLDADTGNVLAEGGCKYTPESNAGAPTYDELVGNGAARLKSTLAGYADTCLHSLKHDMLALEDTRPAPVIAAAPAPAATQPPPAASVSWKGTMACDARQDDGPNHAAYEARFAMEVQGDRVTVHRRTEDVVETLSGQLQGEQLELRGEGYRIGQPNRGWRLAVSGAFPNGASSYVGKGSMSANGRHLRDCELKMTRT